MSEFEIKVTITLVGYESLSADSAELAKSRMEEILDRTFKFSAPLSTMSSDTVITVKRRRRE